MPESTKRLIVGLGNPGTRYAATRHNAGFLLLDRLVDFYKAVPAADCGNYLLWKGHDDAGEIFLMKPLTYMNLSGEALLAFLSKHPIELGNILVAYDDVSLPVGRIRVRPRGSAGGQKGIKHIIEVLQSDEIPRLRLGIDSDARMGRPLPEFVLEDFAEEETALVVDMLNWASQATITWIREGIGPVMARFNGTPPQGESDSSVSLSGGA